MGFPCVDALAERLPEGDIKSPDNLNYQLPTTNYQLPTTNYPLPIKYPSECEYLQVYDFCVLKILIKDHEHQI